MLLTALNGDLLLATAGLFLKTARRAEKNNGFDDA
jgi:hypothetical protein